MSVKNPAENRPEDLGYVSKKVERYIADLERKVAAAEQTASRITEEQTPTLVYQDLAYSGAYGARQAPIHYFDDTMPTFFSFIKQEDPRFMRMNLAVTALPNGTIQIQGSEALIVELSASNAFTLRPARGN